MVFLSILFQEHFVEPLLACKVSASEGVAMLFRPGKGLPWFGGKKVADLCEDFCLRILLMIGDVALFTQYLVGTRHVDGTVAKDALVRRGWYRPLAASTSCRLSHPALVPGQVVADLSWFIVICNQMDVVETRRKHRYNPELFLRCTEEKGFSSQLFEAKTNHNRSRPAFQRPICCQAWMQKISAIQRREHRKAWAENLLQKGGRWQN